METEWSPLDQQEKDAIDRSNATMKRHTRVQYRLAWFGLAVNVPLLVYGWFSDSLWPSMSAILLCVGLILTSFFYQWDHLWHPDRRAGDKAWIDHAARNKMEPPPFVSRWQR